LLLFGSHQKGARARVWATPPTSVFDAPKLQIVLSNFLFLFRWQYKAKPNLTNYARLLSSFYLSGKTSKVVTAPKIQNPSRAL